MTMATIMSATMDILRVWLSLVFVFAGLAKLHYPHGARLFLLAVFPRFPHRAIQAAVGGLAVAEILVGFALLLSYRVALAAAIALAMLLGALVLQMVRRDRIKVGCGCFGIFDSTADHHRSSNPRTAVFLVVALAVLGREALISSSTWSPQAFVAGCALFTVSALLYLVAFRGTRSRVSSIPVVQK